MAQIPQSLEDENPTTFIQMLASLLVVSDWSRKRSKLKGAVLDQPETTYCTRFTQMLHFCWLSIKALTNEGNQRAG